MYIQALNTHRPKIKLNGKDITKIVVNLSITESIFDPVVRGFIKTLNTPSANLYQVSDTVGELKKIEFSFHSLTDGQAEKDIKVPDLLVYDMIPQAIDGAQNVSNVTANFMTKGKFVNHSKLVSKYYNNTISNIVTSLCKEIDIQCKAEETDGKIKKVLTYDSVFSHIINLSKQAISKQNPKDVDFVFYQDIEGKYHFKPISSFKKKEVKWKYALRMPNLETTVEEAKYSILGYSTEGISPVRNVLEGMYSSEVISLDTTNGNYYSKTHVWKNGKYTTIADESLVKLNDIFKDIAQSGVAVRRYGKQRFLFDCEEEESGYDKVGLEDDWVGNRLAAMQMIDQVIMYATVPGNSEMRAGDIIEIRDLIGETEIQDSGSNHPLKDVIKTGKFLVTTISHDLTLREAEGDAAFTTYTMRLRLVKDTKGGEHA